MYTPYDLAKYFMKLYHYNGRIPELFYKELPTDVLSELLWLYAENRLAGEMKILIKYGADPHFQHQGYSVLYNLLKGNNGFEREAKYAGEVEECVKILANHGVTRNDFGLISTGWILDTCKDMINASEYLTEFFKVPPVKVYWHLPREQSLIHMQMTFKDVEDAVKTLPMLTNHKQYVAVVDDSGEVTRYLVSKGCGLLEVIPMEDTPGFSDKQKMLSSIVNFVMADDEYPCLSCEEDEDEVHFEPCKCHANN